MSIIESMKKILGPLSRKTPSWRQLYTVVENFRSSLFYFLGMWGHVPIWNNSEPTTLSRFEYVNLPLNPNLWIIYYIISQKKIGLR
jgi:hypothetical protein